MINLESLENSSDDSATDLETDFKKHNDGIGFSTLAHRLRTMPTKSDLYVMLHAWYVRERSES